ncbi:A/G-specific adenine glycosylase [Neisseria leonii]|uniref:A/G-specific adenine glycosylase n=1 Tax=Neisseria leonii TaxID=2995413 RepID=UPI00237A4351|nr:A/G-specific adenine glycosylase [Neisseria sp. 3986]MDD9325166.1 A/G-specific adenine glycosylase [Neisseria sp. 3986]
MPLCYNSGFFPPAPLMPDDFARRLIDWQHRHGRHNLPWHSRDPYRVWLSEIMLQQTQVATVREYFPRFVAEFPDVAALAAAAQDDVLRLWAGLGYYSRARNLHQAAKQIMTQFDGRFPQSRGEWETLCGVGRSTAAAICAFTLNRREAILDGNVKRVLCRVFARDGDPADKTFEKRLWALAESLLPPDAADMPAYTQGLMDLGATVCKRGRPDCAACPMQARCLAYAQNRTAELPRRKKAAAPVHLPLFWLQLRTPDGRLLLEKRPQSGIWAGMYCLPCFENLSELYRFAAAYGLTPDDLTEHPAIAHRLTHRLLDITPFSAVLPQAPATDSGWQNAQQIRQSALPKPLSSWLAQQNLL